MNIFEISTLPLVLENLFFSDDHLFKYSFEASCIMGHQMITMAISQK